MRQTLRLVFGVMILGALPTAVQAQFILTTNNGTLTVTGYTGPGAAVVIPSSTNGLPVVAIGNQAFYNKTTLTSITIPNSVKSIGNSAFIFCRGLTNVSIGINVTSIGSSAFDSCSSLTSVTIPEGVINIGNGAFDYCNSLTVITVETLNPFYGTVDGVLFNKSKTTLIQYPPAKPGNSYTLPNSVNTIGDGAFCVCRGLASVNIPSSVTNIVGGGLFYGCTSLTAITVDTSSPAYSSLGGVLFNKLQSILVQYPGGRSGSYTVPNSVADIGEDAFGYCPNLISVTIPGSVTNIGAWAFEDCANLATLTIGSRVSSIGYGAFASPLKAVYFKGNSPASVDAYVFGSYYAVTVYYLPGTAGWSTSFAGRPAVLWNPQMSTSNASFSVGTNGFGFNITGTANIPVVVEASADLDSGAWVPLRSLSLTSGLVYFSDPEWTNHSTRLYRLRSP